MMALDKSFIRDLSVEVLEYPETIIPEQGLKRKMKCLMQICKYTKNSIQPHTRSWIWSCDGLATLNFIFSHA